MRTVQDIVNNLLNGYAPELVRFEAAGQTVRGDVDSNRSVVQDASEEIKSSPELER